MNQAKILPISEYQKRFFLEWVLAPDDTIYNISLVYKIKGNFNKEALKYACEVFIQKHEIYHAKYNIDGTECLYANYAIDDFYQVANFDSMQDVNVQLREVLDKPFDLTHDVLLKFYLFNNVADDEYYFIIQSHHIVSDGTSGAVFIHQISTTYNEFCANEFIDHDLPATFSQAVKVERQILTAEYLDEAKSYWSSFVDDVPLSIKLPYKPRIDTKEFDTHLADKRVRSIYFELTTEQLNGLRKYVEKKQTTLFRLLSAVYGVLVAKYCNQPQILVSYAIDMRPKGYAEVTGCFVNNILFKIDLTQHRTMNSLITELTLQRKKSRKYQGYSLTHIVQDIQKRTNENRHFNVGFTQTNLSTLSLDLNGVEVIPVDLAWSENSTYELSLLYDEYSSDKLKFKFEYRIALFNEQSMDSLLKSFNELIDAVISQDDINLDSYCVLDKQSYQQIIYDWNQTAVSYPQDKTIQQLFEEQVEKTPDNIAVVYEDTSLTYRRLNERANQLANYLRETYSVKGDDLIALCLDRSEHIIIAILATLKAGAGYVPLDPSYPEERINYILEDTQAKVLLCNEIYHKTLFVMPADTRVCEAGIHTPVLLPVDSEEMEEQLSGQSIQNPALNITSRNLAYVIYTSGTTGKPKGVMIEHKNVVGVMSALVKLRYLDERSRICQTAPYIFDSSVAEIFPAIFIGAGIYLITEAYRKDLDRIIEYCENNRLTHLFITSKLGELVVTDKNYFVPQVLIVAGEKFNLIGKLDGTQTLINEYGPTEATVCAINIRYYKEINGSVIGKPIANTTAYILDSNLNPLPIGAIGELCVGGAGLARGYLNRADLTVERFIPNPFQSVAEKEQGINTRLYKTGDLVRYLADGNIEYIGRNDFQVKIRGFRIELGEIESRLASYPDIKQVSVLAREYKTSTNNVEANVSGNKYLVAYYVADALLNEEDILSYLSEYLPEYMLPSVIVHLDKLPLNINGKLDRTALPEPEFRSVDNYVAPRTPLEQQICAVYAEVLGLEVGKIGIHDDFFQLGGNSILAIKLIALTNKMLCSNITVAEIFMAKSVEKVSTLICSKQNNYQAVVKLNSDATKPNLFMFHPGGAGFEVYLPMLEMLNINYECYGVDNYNLNHQDKFTSLEELANYYLLQLTAFIHIERPVYLFGWSLGGLIALEIAIILEQRGYKDIKIYLFDTLISDQIINEMLDNDRASLKSSIKEYLKSRYGINHANKVMASYDVERDMIKTILTGKLKHSKIVLYKAMRKEERFSWSNSDIYYEAVNQLRYNNIDSVTKDITQITVHNIEDAHHGDILEKVVLQGSIKLS